jgi:hypothetical protein
VEGVEEEAGAAVVAHMIGSLRESRMAERGIWNDFLGTYTQWVKQTSVTLR